MRPFCLALSLGVLASPAGCASGFDRAKEHRERVEAGMDRAEVRARLGQPDEWGPEPDAAQAESWRYRYDHNAAFYAYEIGMSTVSVLTLGLAALVLLPPFVLWVEAHGPPGVHTFEVRFQAGKVSWISPVEADRR